MSTDPRHCTHCKKPLGPDEGRRFHDPDDWFVPDQLGISGPCILCDDCVAEAKGSMTDDERELFEVD